jgi:uncharacterized membrane protein YfcA
VIVPELLDSSLALAAVVLAAFTGFYVSAVVGIGGALILLPVLMIWLPPAAAVALASPIMLLNNGSKLAAYLRHLDIGAALRVCATAMPAAAIGAAYVGVVPAAVLRVGVALLILTTVALSRAGSFEVRTSARGLLAWGVGIGAISGLAGAAGGPVAIALRGYGLAKERFVATVGCLAIGMQLVKIPSYVASSVLPAEHLPFALGLGATSIVAALLGRRTQRYVDAQRFRALLDVMLLALAVWLVVGALR